MQQIETLALEIITGAIARGSGSLIHGVNFYLAALNDN